MKRSTKKVELSKKFLTIYKNVKKQRKMMEELMIHENKRLQGEGGGSESSENEDGGEEEGKYDHGIREKRVGDEVEMKDLKVE